MWLDVAGFRNQPWLPFVGSTSAAATDAKVTKTTTTAQATMLAVGTMGTAALWSSSFTLTNPFGPVFGATLVKLKGLNMPGLSLWL